MTTEEKEFRVPQEAEGVQLAWAYFRMGSVHFKRDLIVYEEGLSACTTCRSLVADMDRDAHTRYHDKLAGALARAQQL